MHPWSKADQQLPGPCYTEHCQEVNGGDPSLLSIGETHGVLFLVAEVLGYKSSIDILLQQKAIRIIKGL